jgi:hypothetical protein
MCETPYIYEPPQFLPAIVGDKVLEYRLERDAVEWVTWLFGAQVADPVPA